MGHRGVDRRTSRLSGLRKCARMDTMVHETRQRNIARCYGARFLPFERRSSGSCRIPRNLTPRPASPFADSIPCVAHGRPRVIPPKPSRSLAPRPSGIEFLLYIVPLPARVLLARFPTIAVCGLIHAVFPARRRVWARRVIATPISVLDRRIHFLAHAVTGQAAGDRANRAAHRKADRATDERADRKPREIREALLGALGASGGHLVV